MAIEQKSKKVVAPTTEQKVKEGGMVEERIKFPTEIIDLPSKGYFYPEGHPLSSGKVEMKYMTAKEEDILTSQNLIKKGVAIDMLLKSLIVTPGVNYNDLTLGDKNAIMIAARVLGYGKDYEFDMEDPDSGEQVRESVDLALLENKDVDYSQYKKGINEYGWELPTSKRKITFRIMTHKDEQNVTQELKSMKKVTKRTGIDPEITTRLKHVIASVDGNDDQAFVRKFVDNELLSRDSLALRNYIQTFTPDIDMDFIYTSVEGNEHDIAIPLTVEFFWPRSA